MSKRRHKTEVGTEGIGRERHGESRCVNPRASTTTSLSPTIPFGNPRIKLSCAGTEAHHTSTHSMSQGPRLEEKTRAGFRMQLVPRADRPLQQQELGQHWVLRPDHSTLLSVPAGSNPSFPSIAEGAAPDLDLAQRRGGGDAESCPLQMGASPADTFTSDWVHSRSIWGGLKSHHYLLPVLSIIPRLQSPQAHLFSH